MSLRGAVGDEAISINQVFAGDCRAPSGLAMTGRTFNMIILGIDPGTHATGYGLIKKDGRKVTHVDNGVISPSTKNSLPEKLAHIFNELKIIILKFKPDVVAIEEVFVATNARSALILGHARGAAMLAASESGLPVHEYSTREIKKAVVGYGNADKNQVAQMVKRLLNLPEVPASDAADAIAAALCHEQTFRVTGCPKTPILSSP